MAAMRLTRKCSIACLRTASLSVTIMASRSESDQQGARRRSAAAWCQRGSIAHRGGAGREGRYGTSKFVPWNTGYHFTLHTRRPPSSQAG